MKLEDFVNKKYGRLLVISYGVFIYLLTYSK